jgi:hypothetical protein
MKMLSLISLRSAILSTVLMGSAFASHGQGTLASGTIAGTQESPSLWLYTITLTDTGSTPIDSLWYAWTPDVSPNFYLPDTSASDITGQDGWTGTAVNKSIQFSGGTALTTGESVLLSYDADFSPTTLSETANSGLSVAYDGGIEGGPSTGDITIEPAPEPTALALFGTAIMGMAAARRRFQK